MFSLLSVLMMPGLRLRLADDCGSAVKVTCGVVGREEVDWERSGVVRDNMGR